jgi:hypothetical protein
VLLLAAASALVFGIFPRSSLHVHRFSDGAPL